MNNPLNRLKHSWSMFANEQSVRRISPSGSSSSSNPVRHRLRIGTEKTTVNSVYNRISVDAASLEFHHVQLDDDDRFSEIKKTTLNECLSVEANIDQTSRAFFQDAVMSLLDDGYIAIVPVETTTDPIDSNVYDIQSLRVGKITQWFPRAVTVDLYNDQTGMHKEVTLPKNMVAIIENPFFSVMNEYNSTMQRLIRKLSLLDSVDEESSHGGLDLIVQLPYAIKTEAKRAQALQRRKEMEEQLNGARYGVAYIDGTESVTQLNRSLDNNLMKQVEYLTTLLYSQLSITQSVMDGTADDKTMTNYYNRTIEPIVGAIVAECNRKFLTKTARTQGQAIMSFRDPFKLIPVSEMPEVADKFTRNEITSSNEIRQAIGMRPSKDPSADELRNKNLNKAAPTDTSSEKPVDNNIKEEENDNA